MTETFETHHDPPPENSDTSVLDKLQEAAREVGKGFEDALNKREQRIHHTEKQYGVHMDFKDGKCEYHLKVNGEDQVLFKTDATEEGLKQGDRMLHQMVLDKEQALSNKFEVHFSQDGEKVYQAKDGHLVNARDPRLDELCGIEAALKHSKPTQYLDNNPNGEGIKINFLREKTEGAAAYVVPGIDGKEQVFVEPSKYGEFPMTEKDTKEPTWSLEGVLTHEFAHNAQHKEGWDDPKQVEQRVKEFGWHPYIDEKQKTAYLFEAKDGSLYKPVVKNFYPVDWIKCDASGSPLDATGHHVSEKKAAHLTPDEMQQDAKIRPITSYYPDPWEMDAEGMKFFRLNRSTRGQLMEKSPELYQLIKKQDQAEIDAKYGAGKFVRLPDGSLAENTHDSREAIATFEAQHQK